MTRNNTDRPKIALVVAPSMVASIIGAMSPMIGEAADETSQPWERYKKQMHSNFPGFLAESQQTISTAMNELGKMPADERQEAKASLTQEQSALNTLAKASNIKQVGTAQVTLNKTGLKFNEFKKVPPSLAKAHLAATSSMLYAIVKSDEMEGYNTPNKAALSWVKYMDQQHKAVQQSAPDYKFSKSHRFVTAIHNFYTCGTSTAKDTASKSRDMSKESIEKPGNR